MKDAPERGNVGRVGRVQGLMEGRVFLDNGSRNSTPLDLALAAAARLGGAKITLDAAWLIVESLLTRKP